MLDCFGSVFAGKNSKADNPKWTPATKKESLIYLPAR
jgi:hypothetical protein